MRRQRRQQHLITLSYHVNIQLLLCLSPNTTGCTRHGVLPFNIVEWDHKKTTCHIRLIKFVQTTHHVIKKWSCIDCSEFVNHIHCCLHDHVGPCRANIVVGVILPQLDNNDWLLNHYCFDVVVNNYVKAMCPLNVENSDSFIPFCQLNCFLPTLL